MLTGLKLLDRVMLDIRAIWVVESLPDFYMKYVVEAVSVIEAFLVKGGYRLLMWENTASSQKMFKMTFLV